MTDAFDDEIHRWYSQLRDKTPEERQRVLEELSKTQPALAARISELFAVPDFATMNIVEGIEPVARMPPKQLDQFELLEPISDGAQGIVYRARQKHPDRLVALKVMRTGSIDTATAAFERFRDEANILGLLEHPGIARIHLAGVVADDGVSWPYIAMELIEPGASLVAFANARGLVLSERLSLIQAVCDAVHYAHERGVVHRDLKPANVLVDRTGHPRVVDFGIASLGRTHKLKTAQTQTGAIMGTPAYMSPEQASLGARSVDRRADVYSLGAIAYELFAGKAPLIVARVGDTPILEAIATIDPIPLDRVVSRFPKPISDVIDTALRKKPEDRYASAAEFSTNLQRAFDGLSIDVRPLSNTRRALRLAWRYKALSFALLTLVISSAVIVGLSIGKLAAEAATRVERARREVAVAQRFASLGEWEQAGTTLDGALEIAECGSIEIDLLRIDVLEGQGRIEEERALIDSLVAGIDAYPKESRARILLLAGDRTRENHYKYIVPDLSQVEAALATGSLGPADRCYAESLLATDPREQVAKLEQAVRLDPSHHRAHEMLSPALLFTGQPTRALVAARAFRGRFPHDPGSGIMELGCRALVEGAVPSAIWAEYPDVPAGAVQQLSNFLQMRKLPTSRLRATTRATIAAILEQPEWKREITKTAFADLADMIVQLPMSGTDATFDALLRLPPRLVTDWSTVVSKSISDSLDGRYSAELGELIESRLAGNDDAFFVMLRGYVAAMEHDARLAGSFFHAAARKESLLDLNGAPSLFAVITDFRIATSDVGPRAIDETRRLLQRDDLVGIEYRFLAECARMFGEPALANEILWRWIGAFPDDPDAKVALAEVAFEDGDPKAIASRLEKVLEECPTHARALALQKRLEKR